ncbi:MAG: hypothetical protein HC778_09000, partial [Chamaesiphon sp. CSU_1_12]|nr:hypothetical protein [Chamaesiphon sp. CSU_1_12]
RSIVSPNLSLVDKNSANLAGATITITNLLDGAAETLAATTTGSIAASYNNGTLTLSGTGTVAQYQQVLRSITYNNTAANPDLADRSIQFVVDDGMSNSNTSILATTTLTFNDAPTATNKTLTTNEDLAKAITAADFGFSDVDSGNTLQKVQITTLPTQGVLEQFNGTNWLSVTNNAEITTTQIAAGLRFTPVANANGTNYASIGFKVSDGLLYSVATNTLTFNVTPVNDVPTAANKTLTTDEDTAKVLTVADFGFSDIDSGDTLQKVQITTLPTQGVLEQFNGTSWVTVASNAEITTAQITAGLRFKPATNANGNNYASLGFKVSDGNAYSAAANTLTFNVNAVNDAPTAANRTLNTDEDTARVLNVNNFGFSDVDSGNTLQKVKIITLPTQGVLEKFDGTNWLAVDSNDEITTGRIIAGWLRFTPAANANGNNYASIGFKVSDGLLFSVATNTLTFNVTPVNDVPTAANKTLTTNEDTAKVLTAADFGFSDVDSGDTLQKVKITTVPTQGVLEQFNGTNWVAVGSNAEITTAQITAGLRFSPVANANGNNYANIGFKVSDGTVFSTNANTLTFNITSVNDAPTGANNTLTTNEDTPKVLIAADFGFSDVDSGNTLQKVQITTLPTQGVLEQFNGTNWVAVTNNAEITTAQITTGLRFSPATNANGTSYASIGFKVSDGNAFSVATNTLTFNVTAVNDAPTVVTPLANITAY